MDPATIISGIGALGGLFKKKPKDTTRQTTIEGIMGQALGATQAAKETGINRLTLLGASSPIASSSGGGDAPLASLSVFGQFLEDKYGQDAKDRKEHNRLQNDLLRLELDRANAVRPVATVNSIVAAGPYGQKGRAVQAQGEGEWQGPLAPVRVRNGLSGEWISLDPMVAKRMRVTNGEALIGEDWEALLGDVASEVVNVASIGQGGTVGQQPIIYTETETPAPAATVTTPKARFGMFWNPEAAEAETRKRTYTAVPFKPKPKPKKKVGATITPPPRIKIN